MLAAFARFLPLARCGVNLATLNKAYASPHYMRLSAYRSATLASRNKIIYVIVFMLKLIFNFLVLAFVLAKIRIIMNGR